MPNYNFDLNGKTVWVAGETGMVGRALLKRLNKEPCTLLNAPHSDLDLTNQQDTSDWISQNKPDVIIVAAAKVGGILANKNSPADFLYDNLAIGQNIIHAAYKNNVERLIYLGSSCIYPKHTTQPIDENALLSGKLEDTNEAYAIAKIAIVKLCEYYHRQYGYNFTSVLPTNLYGENDNFDKETSHVIPALITKIHEAKEYNQQSVELWGTGNPLREFLHIDDLANAILAITTSYNDSTPINIGYGAEISIHDLAHKVKNLIGFDGDITFDASKPDGTPRKLLNSDKIKALGWSADISLDDGLRTTYDWFKKSYASSKV